MNLKRLAITTMMLVLAGISTVYFWYQGQLTQPLTIGSDGYRVEVQRGASLANVLNRMVSDGVLESALPSRLYAKQNDLAGQIKVGEFVIPQGTQIAGLFAILTSNDQVQYRITFVEGQTVKDALLRLQSDQRLKHLIDYPTVLEDTKLLFAQLPKLENKTLEEHLGANPNQPEGLLYPDTYFFHKGDTDLSLIKRSHERLLEVVEKEWQAKAKNLPLKTPYEALTLASIIEKETGKPSERPEIAGVFVRRLEKGMRLQTDPTVIYGLGDRYQGNITRKHLKEKTAYNTYRINGLPPTPIALVGEKAIHAALNPLAGETLYFVAKGDGTHQFSKTIDEHNRAVRKYQLTRRADYRSTHQQVK